MPVKLGTLLIREGVLSPQQLEESLRLQVLYGGRLGTNLVELGAIHPDDLVHWLAQSTGFPAATEAMLAAAPDEIVHLLTAEVAERNECFPFQRDGRRLLVAMSKPGDLVAVDAISFKVGLRVVPHVVPELMLYHHLEKRYGVARKIRYTRLASRVSSQPPPKRRDPEPPPPRRETLPPRMMEAPAVTPPPLFRAPDEDITVPVGPPHAYGAPAASSWAPPAATTRAFAWDAGARTNPPPPPEHEPAAVAHAPAPPQPATTEPPSRPPPPLPPPRPAEPPGLSLAEVIAALGTVPSRDGIADTLLHFAPERIDTMLVFVIRDGLAIGWKGRGPLDSAQAARLMLPLNVPSLFHDAVESRKPVGGAVEPSDLHRHFYKALKRDLPPTALVVPVLVKDKPVNLIYVDCLPGIDPMTLTDPLLEIAHQIPATYARLLKASKQAMGLS